MERLLQERCVRNQLDERMLPRLLDAHPAARRCLEQGFYIHFNKYTIYICYICYIQGLYISYYVTCIKHVYVHCVFSMSYIV